MQASASETLLLIIEMLSLLSTLAALLRQKKIIHPTSYPKAYGLAPINKSLSSCAWNSCWWLPSSRGDRNTSGICRAAKQQRGDEPKQPSLVHTAASAQHCCSTWEPRLLQAVGQGGYLEKEEKCKGYFSSFAFPHCSWIIWLCSSPDFTWIWWLDIYQPPAGIQVFYVVLAVSILSHSSWLCYKDDQNGLNYHICNLWWKFT